MRMIWRSWGMPERAPSASSELARLGRLGSCEDHHGADKPRARARGSLQHPANQAFRKSKMSDTASPPPLKSARGSPANQAFRKSKMSDTLRPPPLKSGAHGAGR